MKSGDTSLNFGDSALLICVAFGIPSVDFSWVHKEETIVNDSLVNISQEDCTRGGKPFRKSILKICNVSLVHSGAYTCSVNNGLWFENTSISLWIAGIQVSFLCLDLYYFLICIYAATLVTVPSSEIFPIYQSNSSLKCVAQGFPIPGIWWYLEDQKVANGSSIISSNIVNFDGEDFVESTFFLSSGVLESSSNISCLADNGILGGDQPLFNISINVESKMMLSTTNYYYYYCCNLPRACFNYY